MVIEDGVLESVSEEDIAEGKFEIPESVIAIGRSAFEGCSGLREITIPESVISIGRGAFEGCSDLREITIPESVTKIGYGAFAGCSGLREIIIPESVTEIGDGAFGECSDLREITIPESVTQIRMYAFGECIGLRKITIPESITKIGSSAFEGCRGLTEITIPESVNEIGFRAFKGCRGLRKIIIPESVIAIGRSAFRGCSDLREITIPESVTQIEMNAFEGCSGLEEITIPESVIAIGRSAFRGCSGLTEITIPESVTKIGVSAFEDCSDLRKITIPESVTQIEEEAFSGCSGLREITIPDSVTEIGWSAFRGCSGLTEITIPESVTKIESSAFSGCSGLKEITIPESVTKIKERAFRGCSGLKEITIPESVTQIGRYAFGECSGLRKITIPESVTKIESNAFSGCSGLKEIIIPESIIEIGFSAFEECRGLTKITIPESVTNIDKSTFERCSGLREIIIPESVTEIGDYAFRGCSGLKEITIPESVTNIGKSAFEGCSGLREITIPESVTEIGENAFEDGVMVKIKNNPEPIKIGWNDDVYIKEYNNNAVIVYNRKEIQLLSKNKEMNKAEKEEYDKLAVIIDNLNFKQSSNYNTSHAINYATKMINILGIEATYNLLKIPDNISEQELQSYNEEISKVYKPRYKLKGNAQVVLSIFENIDTLIAKNSNNVRNDRNKFYTKFNEILQSGEKINLIELLEKCSQEIGIELTEENAKKIKKEIQTEQLTVKSEEIKSKIRQKIENPELHITQQGVSRTLLYNVIRRNVLNDGTIENISEILNREIHKRKEDGQYFYGENIRNQKELYNKVLNDLYNENTELLNTDTVKALRDTKEKIGNRWILKLKESKNSVRNIEKMTEEEKEKFTETLQKIGIEPEYSKKYELNSEMSQEEILTILTKSGFRDILTYEKAEMIFDNMTEPYSENFANWFIEHQKEIISNQEFYSKIYILHNEFEKLLEDPMIKATFDNKRLSVQHAFDIYNQKEKEVSKGNEELGSIASRVDITQDELHTAEKIFNIAKQREGSYIPPAKSTQKRYRGRILRPDDPMIVLAGNATNCCQKVGGVGGGSMMHAATENTGTIFLVEETDENGNVIKPVAQSWVWRNNDRVCFDNIEIPVAEQQKLSMTNGDIEAQQEILQIYKDTAQNMIKVDEKVLKEMLRTGKIAQSQFNKLVLKEVTVGVGYNDLGILEHSELEKVEEADIILPKEADKSYYGQTPWIDSGRNSVVGRGAQLYLAKGEKIEEKTKENEQEQINYQQEKQEQLEDLPLLYSKEREVRRLKSHTIDKGVVEQIKGIEETVYRDKQKMLAGCESFEDIAKKYEMDPRNIQVHISREKDWYIIYEERGDEVYIADLAMVNGINSQRNDNRKTDVIQSTMEMTEDVYSIMLEAAKKGKQVRFEATEDTSYKNINHIKKLGLIKVLEDNEREWSSTLNVDDGYEDDYYEDDYYEDEYDEEEYYDDKYYDDENTLNYVNNDTNESDVNYIDVSEGDKNNETVKNETIIMHDMLVKVDEVKLQKELNGLREKMAKRTEKKLYTGHGER